MNKPIQQSQLRNQQIIDFCNTEKTTKEIAAHTGLKEDTVNDYLQRLQRSKQIIRIKPLSGMPKGGIAYTYRVSKEGDELPPPVVEEPQIDRINHDFVRVMHKVLALGAV